MLVALSGGQKLGIVAVAAVFVAFSLLASFVLPRRDPNFPGARGLPVFIAITAVLFVAMMSAMIFLAREEEEEREETPAAAETQPSEPPAGGGGAAEEGDPEAGREVFSSAGCTGCHTLAAAGSRGTVGPSLDATRPSYEKVVDRVTNGMGAMPAFKDELSEEQIRDVAAFVVQATQGE